MTKPILTQEYLKECLSYDPETGVFTWKTRPRKHFTCNWSWKVHWNRDGKEAGYLDPTGYVHIRLNNVLYKAHRLAFLYVHGYLPTLEVDHINHVRSDNRLVNLREVSTQGNAKNASRRKDNISGYTGICWLSKKDVWLVQIGTRKKFVGHYANLDDAIKARKMEESRLLYHENHGKAL